MVPQALEDDFQDGKTEAMVLEWPSELAVDSAEVIAEL
jgi:hypothetical protein